MASAMRQQANITIQVEKTPSSTWIVFTAQPTRIYK